MTMLRTNLSTRPFYNERAVRSVLGLFGLIALGLTLFNIYEIVRLQGQSRDSRQTIAQNDQSHALEAFLTNPAENEVDIAVQNVSLTEIRNPPYKAAVTFQKLLYTSGTRSERGHQTYVAQIDFVIRAHVPNEFVRVNPLGLQVTYFRVDQAFEEAK